jgi:hypothetical protein
MYTNLITWLDARLSLNWMTCENSLVVDGGTRGLGDLEQTTHYLLPTTHYPLPSTLYPLPSTLYLNLMSGKTNVEETALTERGRDGNLASVGIDDPSD